MREEAVAFASGMAAVSATLLATVAAGRPRGCRPPPCMAAPTISSPRGCSSKVSWAAPASIGRHLRPDTGLVIIETPEQPSLDLVDIAAVAAAAGDVPVLVDNTFATPVLQQPARFGATLVLHSATKFIGGHGDLLGGVVATTPEWAARLRAIRAITGGLLAPTSAYQLHRGLQTRCRSGCTLQASTAAALADWLGAHPAVATVHYPGAPGCDPWAWSGGRCPVRGRSSPSRCAENVPLPPGSPRPVDSSPTPSRSAASTPCCATPRR